MLTLLTGTDRTGLTANVFSQIKAHADAGVSGQILIVPEQFSHEAERRLCSSGGDSISRFAEVLSFSRLSDRLATVCGGAARLYLDKGGQLLAMALAAEQIASRIKYYSAVLRKPEFLSDLLRMIGEFQSYCLLPDMLLEAAKYVEGEFSVKLEELGLLYEAYLAVCTHVAADPADKLTRLNSALSDGDWLDGRTVYVDGFSDFTGAELAVLETILLGCRHLVITVPSGPDDTVLDRPARSQIMQLQRMAERLECACQVESVAQGTHRDLQLQRFLDGLFSSDAAEPMLTEQVHLRTFDSVEEECRGAVLYIKKLLAKGVRCREISIACADRGAYDAPIRAVFRASGLPVYFAGETDILSSPVVGAVLNSLSAAVGPMEYEDVALYLKSGLPLLERDRCDRLDNYAYLWSLRGTQWEKPWTLHPRGFGEPWTEEDTQTMEQLNRDRERALEPLLALRDGLRAAKSTADMVIAFYGFLEHVQLRHRLQTQANESAEKGDGRLAQELLQLHETLTAALEQMWMTLGKTQRSPEDFYKLYQLLLTKYQIGTIPAGLDQIYVSDLPDLRHRQTKHLLLLGAGDGKLPAYKQSEGLLTEDERRALLDHGLSMAPGRADQMDMEILKIYHAVSAVEQSLWMSYAGDQPAWLFRRGCDLVQGGAQNGKREIPLDLQSLAARRLRYEDTSGLNIPELSAIETQLRLRRNYTFSPLNEDTIRKLYGSPIALSPSKIDQFAACRFEYFMLYGMKAKPRKQAKLDQPAFGTFVHAVLEHTVLRVKEAGGFGVISRSEILQIATEEINAYADTYFPEQADRERYLFARSQIEILGIVEDLWEELRFSQFKPEFCELKFAKDSLLPLIVIRGEKTDCQITGTIDRVDLYDDGKRTYVRVVDYKTGSKDFDYTDILNGAGLQMLIYLFALREFGGTYLQRGDLEPAGVLYLPARRDYPLTGPLPTEEDVQKEHRERRKRKGLIRSDQHLLAAMEENPDAPRFMPYKMGKNGPSGNLADYRQMIMLERHVLRSVEQMADQIASGDVAPNPVIRGQNTPCRYCDYRSVCHKDLGTQSPRILAETSAKQFWDKLEQEEQNHG